MNNPRDRAKILMVKSNFFFGGCLVGPGHIRFDCLLGLMNIELTMFNIRPTGSNNSIIYFDFKNDYTMLENTKYIHAQLQVTGSPPSGTA